MIGDERVAGDQASPCSDRHRSPGKDGPDATALPAVACRNNPESALRTPGLLAGLRSELRALPGKVDPVFRPEARKNNKIEFVRNSVKRGYALGREPPVGIKRPRGTPRCIRRRRRGSRCGSFPESCARAFSTNRVPKPRRSGTETGGPPISRHTILSSSRRSSCQSHLNSTRPPSCDRAPYLMALVHSSCRTIAIETD